MVASITISVSSWKKSCSNSSIRQCSLLSWGRWRALLFLIIGVLLVECSGCAHAETTSDTTGLACEASGMCSLGEVKPFTGDVLLPASMRSCLEARSFRREVILLTETRLNPAYQTFRQLLSLGYEHVVLLSLEERCARSTATWPRLACVWSSQPFVSNTKYLLDRVAFMTRGSRLGYNLLMLDSDVLVLRDVYSHLKSPPLANATIATMRDGNGWVNCGVVYVQNARPDGPAAYMLGEVVDRLERWGENPGFYTGRGLQAFCWDQQMYSDTLLSALAGRPISFGCWFRHEPSLRAEWEAAHVRLFTGDPAATGPLESRHYLRHESLPWPPELLEAAPEYPKSTDVWWGTLRVPNSRGEWPSELGGALYPPHRGTTSQQWRDLLEADIQPLWPDPEDPSLADVGASIVELFAYLPMYLAESWSNGGSYGYWNPALLSHGPGRPAGHPPVDLAHFVHVPGGATNKLTVKMASGNWDWDVAHAAHPNRGVFFASTHTAPVPDVLALSPDVEAREWANEEEFAAAVGALMRLAAEMGRAVAYPAPRCNVSWLGGERNNKLPLAVAHAFHIPYAPPDKGFNDLRCLWGGYLQYGCQAVRSYFAGGLLAPEYDHLRHLLTADHATAAAASAANLQSLGFHPAIVAAAAIADTTGPFRPGGTEGGGGSAAADSTTTPAASATAPAVAVVPSELLTPPAAATAWDVTELAARLMDQYGGAGSGLVVQQDGGADSGGDGAAAGSVAGGPQSGSSTSTVGGSSSGGSGSSRPRVLVLPEVPRLTDKPGPRFELFKEELETGTDRNVMSCEWIRTGRPYRRRQRSERRRLRQWWSGREEDALGLDDS